MADQLSILSLDYYPIECIDGFQDNIEDITSLQFKEFGVKCSCNNKIYYNKYTFKAQHLKTQKHQDYLKKLVDDKPNLVKTLKDNQQTIKTLKIQLGTSDQKLTQSLHSQKRNEANIDLLLNEIAELKTQLTDRDEYINEMELIQKKAEECSIDTVTRYKKATDRLKQKYTKTETILKQFMTLYEYEVE